MMLRKAAVNHKLPWMALVQIPAPLLKSKIPMKKFKHKWSTVL